MSDNQIYDSLPSFYSTWFNDVGEEPFDSYYLTHYWAQYYQEWIDSLNAITNFNGDYEIFNDEQLDSIAPFFGFTEADDWYSKRWKKETKIKLFRGTYNDPWIWRFRGSHAVFSYLCQCFGISAEITTDSGFVVGRDTPGEVIGGGSTIGEVTIVYPRAYLPTSVERQYLQYIVDKFVPIHIKTRLRQETMS